MHQYFQILIILSVLLSAGCASTVTKNAGERTHSVTTSYGLKFCPCNNIILINGMRYPVRVWGDDLHPTLLYPGDEVTVELQGPYQKRIATYRAFGINAEGIKTGAVEVRTFRLSDRVSDDHVWLINRLHRPGIY